MWAGKESNLLCGSIDFGLWAAGPTGDLGTVLASRSGRGRRRVW